MNIDVRANLITTSLFSLESCFFWGNHAQMAELFRFAWEGAGQRDLSLTAPAWDSHDDFSGRDFSRISGTKRSGIY